MNDSSFQRAGRVAAWAVALAAVFQLAMVLGSSSGLAAGFTGATLVAVYFIHQRLPSSEWSEPSSRAAKAILAAIVLLGLGLRVYDLLGRPAWDDEMWTLRNIYTADWGTLLRVALDDYWPPLHYVILSVVTRVANTELQWLRLPSAVFGAATIAATYWFAKEVLESRWAGLLGAGLLTGMTYHIQYSQEARVYALLVLLAALSAAAFYRSFWERRVSIPFILATVLLTYAHSFSAWYFVAAQWSFILLVGLWTGDRGLVRPAVRSQLIVLACWTPLVAGFVISRLTRAVIVPTFWATGADDAPTVFELIELYQTLAIRSWAGAALIVLGASLAVYAALDTWNRNGAAEATPSRFHGILFVLCCILVPVSVSLGVTVATPLDTFPATRYHIAVLPAICVLVGGGLARLRGTGARTAVVATMVLLPASELPEYYRDFDRLPYDQAARFVAERRVDGEPILVGNGFRVFAYYYRGVFPRIGSQDWDRLVEAYAGEPDRYTMETPKYGDSYAHEKIPAEIINVGKRWISSRVDALENERAEGRLDYPYWLVLGGPGRDVLRDLAWAGLRCAADVARAFDGGVTVRYCTRPEGGDSTGDSSPEV